MSEADAQQAPAGASPPADETAEEAAAAHHVRWLRGDVDGLRALAIVLVVAFHAELPGMDNGFIGVDVFFAISGFLITRNLLRDTDGGARPGLLAFWARRLRRLVPAQALVVAVTLVAAWVVLPIYRLGDVATQAAAASLYLSNVLFARDATDYFAPAVGESPLLHTWSLGVEEQFYLLWPLLFVAAAVVAARRGRLHRIAVVAGFAVVLIGSMAVSLWLTRGGDPSAWAFFSLPSRAWEFAAAGLLAALTAQHPVRHRGAATGLALGGSALLVVALTAIPTDAAYPGLWAVLPVGATLALIAAGTADNPVSAALAARPTQWLGRQSYSWYLWHWPAMVLAVAAVGSDSVGLRLAAGAATLPVAVGARRFVEDPVRFHPGLARRGRTYAMAAAVTVAVLATAAVVGTAPDRVDPDSLDGRLLAAAGSNDHRECRDRPVIAGVTTCVIGDVGGDVDVVVVGDSHALQWKPALDAHGRAEGIRYVTDIVSGCQVVPIAVARAEGEAACAQRWDRRLALLDELEPDVVVVAQWSGYLDRIRTDVGGERADADRRARWGDGYATMLDDLTGTGAEVIVVLDEPWLAEDPLACAARHGATEPCEPARDEALAGIGPLRAAELEVLATRPDVGRVDLVDVLCDEDRCRIDLGGTFVYADGHHLSAPFVRNNVDLLGDAVDRALAETSR